MKKFSKKGVLLFAGAMAVCAFAMPSMASASSWGTVGSHHTLTSSNLGFTSPIGTSMCTGSSFTARVLSTADLQITASTFAGCTLIAPALGATCVMTMSGTFATPWTATARTTSDIQIHSVDIDTAFDNDTGTSCGALTGQSARITGTLSSVKWHGNGATRTLELAGNSGVVSHSALGTTLIAPTGTIFDVGNTLSVTG